MAWLDHHLAGGFPTVGSLALIVAALAVAALCSWLMPKKISE